jgi:hypothetical protein
MAAKHEPAATVFREKELYFKRFFKRDKIWVALNPTYMVYERIIIFIYI